MVFFGHILQAFASFCSTSYASLYFVAGASVGLLYLAGLLLFPESGRR